MKRTSEPHIEHPLWSDDDAADAGALTRPYLVLPSPDDPRLVLPTRPHRAAGQIVHALRDSSSLRARAQTAAVRSAVASGLRTTALPDPSLLGVLAQQLGGKPSDFVIGVHLGPARANRKPVVALARPNGELVAFAKWGVNTLTDELVHHEAQALPLVQGLPHVTVPQLIGCGEHLGHPYVLQSPVPTAGASGSWRSRRHPHASGANVTAAQLAVAAVGREDVEVAGCVQHVASDWTARRLGHDADAEIAAFAELATEWCVAMNQTSIPWGSWHGDWRETNMAVTSKGCSVWDWERFSTGVPVGYDALHLFLTSRAANVSQLSALAEDVREHAARLLRPFGIVHRADVELVTTGYFLELAGRYLDDGQAHSGARLGAVAQWLLPHLQQHSARPVPSSRVSSRRGDASS